MGGEGIREGGSDEQWLSYGALNARVGEIAARLQGLAVGERVGLYLSRGPDLVASLLACLRLGLTFVPLEPDFPVERLQDRPPGAPVGGDLRRRQAGSRFRLPAAHPRRAGCSRARLLAPGG